MPWDRFERDNFISAFTEAGGLNAEFANLYSANQVKFLSEKRAGILNRLDQLRVEKKQMSNLKYSKKKLALEKILAQNTKEIYEFQGAHGAHPNIRWNTGFAIRPFTPSFNTGLNDEESTRYFQRPWEEGDITSRTDWD